MSTIERSWLQDTGAAVTNDVAKAKGMTAWSVAKPLGEQLVLLELLGCGRGSTDCECWRDLLRQGKRNTF